MHTFKSSNSKKKKVDSWYLSHYYDSILRIVVALKKTHTWSQTLFKKYFHKYSNKCCMVLDVGPPSPQKGAECSSCVPAYESHENR